jgi:hypothetical protein
MEQIIIDIDPDGTVTLEVKGVVGPGCTALTDGIRKAMGAEVVERHLKPEHAVQTTGAAQKQKAAQRLAAGQ